MHEKSRDPKRWLEIIDGYFSELKLVWSLHSKLFLFHAVFQFIILQPTFHHILGFSHFLTDSAVKQQLKPEHDSTKLKAVETELIYMGVNPSQLERTGTFYDHHLSFVNFARRYP